MIVPSTMLVMRISIFFIFSFDFFGSIGLFFDIFDMLDLDASGIDDEVGDGYDEHAAFDSGSYGVESEIFGEDDGS